MYEDFYKLKAEPFRLSPDHNFCYEHQGFIKARAYMAYAFMRAEGFVMVTGRPGTGKTTLVGELIESLARDNVCTANLVCTQLGADDLLKTVAYHFGIQAGGADKAELIQRLSTVFQRWNRDGRRALLVVDEAQDLSVPAMEELRLLTNIQLHGQPLLQIFLLGQPELRDLILSPELEQVHQRIVAACHLEGLTVAEVESYVLHRLQKVGWTGDPAINKAIFPLIHKFSEGVPRRINLICGRLFLHGGVEQRHQIGVEDLRVVISELQGENLAAGTRIQSRDFEGEEREDWARGADTTPAAEPARGEVQLRAVNTEPPPDSAEPAPPVTPGATRTEGNLGATAAAGLSAAAAAKELNERASPVSEEPVSAAAGDRGAKPVSAPVGDRETKPVSAPVRDREVELARARPVAAAPALAPVAPASPQPAPMGRAESAHGSPESAPERPPARPPRRAGGGLAKRRLGPPLLIVGLLLLVLLVLAIFALPMLEDETAWPSDNRAPLAGSAAQESGSQPEPQRPQPAPEQLPPVSALSTDTGASAIVSAAEDAPEATAPIGSDAERLENVGELYANAYDGERPDQLSAAESADPLPDDEAVDVASGEMEPAVALDETVAAAALARHASRLTGTSETSSPALSELRKLTDPVMLLVSFSFDSIELDADALAVLNEAARVLNAQLGTRAKITGFADQSGDARYNLELSEDRAVAVEEYLVATGVERERLSVEGGGPIFAESDTTEWRPIADREQYRIVQIEITPEGG